MNTKQLFMVALAASAVTTRAEIIEFDLSPAGFDNAIGLSPLNETPPATNSLGSGNEIDAGISLDTDTLVLTVSLGYGSAFGFTDLTAPAAAAHIHGPAGTNAPASVLIDLAPLHVAAGNPSTGGSIVGSVVLSTNQAADLLLGQTYVNIHTTNYPGGEIRGQLIPVNVLPTLVCPPSVVVECTGDSGTLVNLEAQVADQDGDPLEVVWTANGAAMQTNSLPAGTTNLTAVAFSGLYELGTNSVTVSASDGLGQPVTCTTTVAVVDTTPPTIVSAAPSVNVLWPPNHKMIPVQFSLEATDLCGTVTARIKSITSNQHELAKGSGNKAPDWKITGDLSAQLRSERTGKDKNGRTYTITLEAVDNSGNSATTNVTVFVPHSMGKNSQPTPPAHSNAGGNGNGNGNGKGNGKNNGKK